VKGRVRGKASEWNWLPEGYEVRKGQMKFVEEASKAIKSNEVFLGSAPCGIGKSAGCSSPAWREQTLDLF